MMTTFPVEVEEMKTRQGKKKKRYIVKQGMFPSMVVGTVVDSRVPTGARIQFKALGIPQVAHGCVIRIWSARS